MTHFNGRPSLRSPACFGLAAFGAAVMLAGCGSSGSSTIGINDQNSSDQTLAKAGTPATTATTPTTGALSKEPHVTPPAGAPPKALTGAGATFIKSFGKQIGTTPNPYAAYGAQAMNVLLQAVANGGGQRAQTTKNLFGITITNGILGNFTINTTGDTNLLQITIYKQVGKNLVPVKTLVPPANLVSGA